MSTSRWSGKASSRASGVSSADSEKLLPLTYGSNSNYMDWKNKMMIALDQEYVEFAGTFLNEAYPVLPIPTSEDMTLQGYPQNMVKHAMENAVAARVKRTETMEMKKPGAYAFILSKISAQSLDAVKLESTYPVHVKTRDPLQLWKAIKKTHGIGADAGSDVIAAASARIAYSGIKMGQYESIVAFKERFDDTLLGCNDKNEQKVDVKSVPWDFMNALNEKFDEMRVSVHRELVVDPTKANKSLEDMYKLAATYDTDKATIQNRTNNAAFATTSFQWSPS